MKKLFFPGFFLTGILFISIFSCSEQKNPFSVPTHPENWISEESVQFHGKAVLENGPENCQSCHGEKYDGGRSEKSCFSCHELYPHKADWKEKTSHGSSIVAKLYNIEDCESCHGEDHTGGTSEVSCFTCHSQYPHADDWLTPGSDNFHGKIVLNSSTDDCESCHGNDLKGGSSGISCFSCHSNYPHSENWKNQENHGQSIVNNTYTLESCGNCHGSDFTGGSSQVSCFTCHSQFPHPADWITPDQAGFHGTAISNNQTLLTECQDCHGSDYAGGSVNISCFTCHAAFPHLEGFANISSPNFHKNYFRENNNWDISTCRQCHGSDYSGEGNSAKNCRMCHFQPEGPETCNNCHGSPTNFAPPEALHGDNLTTEIGVGAHQNHLTNTTWTTAYAQDCQLCHIKPATFDDAGHIDLSPDAEVTFGVVASDSGNSSPNWDRGTATCTNVYCHGSFIFKKENSANQWGYAFGETEITGNNPAMIWTQVGSGQAECGTCHGLPPQGHIGGTPELDCSICHPSVVDSNKNIINKSLHINGQVNLQTEANSAKIEQLLKRLNIKR